MPVLPSKEAFSELLGSDIGFQEFLLTLSKTERDDIDQIFSDIINQNISELKVLDNLFSNLPEHHHLRQISSSEDFARVPEKALALYNQCRFMEARELLDRSIFLFDLPAELPERGLTSVLRFIAVRVQALCIELLGDIEFSLGNTNKAGFYHRQALELAEKCGDLDTEAKARYGLGCYFWELGDYEQALEYSRGAIDALQGRSDRWSTTLKAMNTLSLIHAELSQIDASLEYCRQALSLAEEVGDLRMIPSILSNRSVQMTNLGLFDEVKPLLDRALSIATDNGSLRQEALIRHNLGMFYLNTAECEDDVDLAMHRFQQSHDISRRIRSVSLEALACSGIAHALVMKDDVSRAEKEYRRAIKLHQNIGAIADAADNLVNLGNLHRYNCGTLEVALESYTTAVELTELIRSRLKRESHRIGLAEARTEPYQQIITTLLELGRNEDAFYYLERARSKALLELLAGQFSSGDGSEQICIQATELARRIDELRRTLSEIQKADETDVTTSEVEAGKRSILRHEVQHGLEQEELLFTALCEELQRVSPEQEGLVSVQASSSAAVQAILTTETALVEFYQTDDLLLLFVIRQEFPVTVVEVALSAADSAEKVFQLVAAIRDPACRNISSHDFLRSVRQPGSWIHETIFGPLKELLAEITHIVIVPHLFWHYLPFHALYQNKNKQYLIDSFEISYAPSASMLEICRRKQRYKRESALILCRNDGDLPHVESEAFAVNKVFVSSSIFQGKEAALDKLTDYRQSPDVLHCACHGYFDHEQPFLSGIAIPPDMREERPTSLMDILRLRLDSSLVTLSACDTGLSRISNADELVGLSRGFLGAGAVALLLSLWKVSDSSTACLMENFYLHYVTNRQTKGRSLQLAMQAVRAEPEYSHPYYWAPFVIMGEWQ